MRDWSEEGRTLWVCKTDAPIGIEGWKITPDGLFGPNSFTPCDDDLVSVAWDGRNFATLHNILTAGIPTSYKINLVRPLIGNIIGSGNFAGNNFDNAVDIQWDGRNWIVFYEGFSTPPVLNTRFCVAKHRSDINFSLLDDLSQTIGAAAILNGGAWDGRIYSASFFVPPNLQSVRTHRADYAVGVMRLVQALNISRTTHGHLAYNGKDFYSIAQAASYTLRTYKGTLNVNGTGITTSLGTFDATNKAGLEFG